MQDQQQEPVSLGSWMLTLFLTFIPLVNLIMLLVWAFSGSTPPSKANWAKAVLLWMVIFFALSILLTLIGGAGVATFTSP
jgi:heme/copper-type cytochrome/quinol oxidase subunit 4